MVTRVLVFSAPVPGWTLGTGLSNGTTQAVSAYAHINPGTSAYSARSAYAAALRGCSMRITRHPTLALLAALTWFVTTIASEAQEGRSGFGPSERGRGYAEADLRKIYHENFLRVLNDVAG